MQFCLHLFPASATTASQPTASARGSVELFAHPVSPSMLSQMAFVSAAPVAPSARASTLAGQTLSHAPAAASKPSRRAASMSAVEFQTYSGGLDRVSIEPYSITRYLFKNAPSTLTEDQKSAVVNAGLRQLFGNAYLMEEERANFYPAESKYRCGEITAKEFVRTVAKSETYRKRFFESVSQYRFIELNFKHFLGRAPLNQVEYSKHFKIFAAGGYEAEIDSYFDDPEYDDVFGEDYMPYTRFRGTYAPINQFNRMCSLEGGWAGSDKCKPVMLVTSLAANVPTAAHTIADGLPAIPNGEHPSKKYDLPSASLERYRNELEIAKAKAYELQVELDGAYRKLQGFRNYVDPFKAMVADMNITPLYGRNYGNGAVKVFSGQYEGAPAASWGASGVENINGPTRRPAANIAKKEKQLEGVKQLVLDLERRVSVLTSEREAPALTPMPRVFQISGLPEVEPVITAQVGEPEVVVAAPIVEEPIVVDDASTLMTGDIDVEDDESGVVVPKRVVVETKRQIAEVGKLPKELIEEIEAEKKASGKDFLEGKGPKPEFPGDGSEMVIGG